MSLIPPCFEDLGPNSGYERITRFCYIWSVVKKTYIYIYIYICIMYYMFLGDGLLWPLMTSEPASGLAGVLVNVTTLKQGPLFRQGVYSSSGFLATSPALRESGYFDQTSHPYASSTIF